MRRPPVVVIGLDLGDWSLIEEGVGSGRLPNIGRLATAGIARPLETPAGELHVSAWPSIYTGTGPGEHGVYYTFQPAPGVQGYRRFAPGAYGRPPVWSLLAAAGVRCTVFDAPYAELDGTPGVTQVGDWGVWAQYLGPGSRPPSLLRGLNRSVGGYPLGLEAHDVGLAGLDPDDLGPRLLRAANHKTEAALWLMREEPWDLFFVVYGETHPGAHYCWLPPGGGGDTGAAQPGLVPLYQEIDRGIGRLVDALPDDAEVCVVSGDSVRPNHGAWHLLPELLRRLGYLAEPSSTTDAPADGGGGGLVRRLRDALPADFRKSLARRLPRSVRDRLARKVDQALVDWSRTRAFCLPTDLEGYIRINLEGREPHGTVKGEEYDAVCEELSVHLRELVNPATGREAVREVIRVRDGYPGPRQDRLPDLVVLWEDDRRLEEVRSPAAGTLHGPSPDERPATHGPPGFLVAGGARSGEGWDDVRHVCDLAPVLLRAFDAPVPDYMRRAVAPVGTRREGR